MVYVLVIVITKSSILLLYLRIFSPSPLIRNLIIVNLWANILFYVVAFFVEMFNCVPRAAIWDVRIQDYHCLDVEAAELASAAFNVVSDFAILVLPISTVWTLQMRTKKKLAVVSVFATGLL